jgi:hypothetical protein
VTPAVTTPPTSASTTPICSGNQFVHLGKIAGITCDRSLGQKLSIAPQMSGLCLVGACFARKKVSEKNRVIGSIHEGRRQN